MNRALTFLLVLIAGSFIFTSPGFTQETPYSAQGTSAFAVFQHGDFDNVNVVNGNLYLNLPLLSYPQRGGKLRLNFSIFLNDKVWHIDVEGSAVVNNQLQTYGFWAPSDKPLSINGGNPPAIAGAYISRDQHYDFGIDQEYAPGTQWNSGAGGINVNNSYTVGAASYFAVGPDGSRHYIGDYGSFQCQPLNDGNCGSQPYMSWQSYYPATDASDIVGPIGSSTTDQTSGPELPGFVTGADGIYYTSTKSTDTNGNYITAGSTGWTDTLNRLIPGTANGTGPGIPGPSYFSNDPLPGNQTTDLSHCPSGTGSAREWQPPSYQGIGEAYYLCYSTINFQTQFNYSNIYMQIADVKSGSNGVPSAVMLTAVILPDGTSYGFQYDSYLSLTKLTLPTGGYISYTWQNQYFVPMGNNVFEGLSRAIKTRTVYPEAGQPSEYWQYQWVLPSTPNGPLYAIVTDPNGNDEEHQLGGLDAGGNNNLSALIETQVIKYNGCGPHNQNCHTTGIVASITKYFVQGLSSGNPAMGSASLMTTFQGLTRRTGSIVQLPLGSGNYRTITTKQTFAPTYIYNCSCGAGPGIPAPGSYLPSTPVFSMQTSESYDANRAIATTYSDDGVGSGVIKTDLTTYMWQGASNNAYQNSGLFNLVAAQGSGPGSITPNTNGTLPSGLLAGTSYSYGNSVVTTGAPRHSSPPPSASVRGNLINSVQALTSLTFPFSGPTTTYTRNDTGTIATSIDPLSNQTSYGYDNSGGYLQTITNVGTGLYTSTGYDFYTGLTMSQTDMNGKSTSYTYYPATNRVNTISYPDGGGIAYQYSTSTPPSITSQQNVQGSNTKNMTYNLDGLGRTVSSILTNDPGGVTTVITSYDSMGRSSCVSQPYRSGTVTNTCTQYDVLSRPVLITNPDGTTKTISYKGEAVETVDEGNGTTNITSIQQKDILGRLLSVCEVTTSAQFGGTSSDQTPTSCGQDRAATGFLTSYVYDILGNLTNVSQGSQSGSSGRQFTYDALSRLLTSLNPESGLTTYTYDADGGVLTRKRLSPNQPATYTNTVATTYSYANPKSHSQDPLHRLGSIVYSDQYINNPPTPSVYYDYDSTSNATFPVKSATNLSGRMADAYTLTPSGTYVSGTGYSYDAMGRRSGIWQCTVDDCEVNGSLAQGWSYQLTYQYDYLGDTYTQAIMDSSLSNTITFTPNAIGQLLSVTSNYVDTYHPATLLSNAQYTAAGNIASRQLGAFETEIFGYDARNRPSYEETTSTAAPSPLYAYTIGTGTWGQAPTTSGYAADGDILNSSDLVTGTWAMTYESLNRIATGSLNNGYYQWLYDRFGNMVQQYHDTHTVFPVIPSFIMSNNRLPGVTYDAAGNVIVDPMNTYAYDSENRLISVLPLSGGNANYSYNADGQRIHRISSSFTGAYVYDNEGRHIGDMTTAGGLQLGEIYAGGRHIASYNMLSNPVATFFIHSDWLGTERARSWYNGTPYEWCTSAAFGDGLSCQAAPGVTNYGSDVSPMHFTGKERDAESGLDNFGFRYYGSNVGRFISPDSFGGHREDPQTLNHYSYVANNPISQTDSNGHDFYLECSSTTHSGCTQVQTDPNNSKSTQWVQAGSDGNATIITSDSIRAGQNSATMTATGLQVNGAQGIYFDNAASHSTDANGNDVNHNSLDLSGSGQQLQGFNFHVDGNCGGTCLSSGQWSAPGMNSAQARQMLNSNGAFQILGEDVVAGLGGGAHPYSTQYRFNGGTISCLVSSCPNTPHLSVPFDPASSYPTYNVPAAGEWHVDAHSGAVTHLYDLLTTH